MVLCAIIEPPRCEGRGGGNSLQAGHGEPQKHPDRQKERGSSTNYDWDSNESGAYAANLPNSQFLPGAAANRDLV